MLASWQTLLLLASSFALACGDVPTSITDAATPDDTLVPADAMAGVDATAAVDASGPTDAEPADVTSPQVVLTTPAAAATEVARDSTVAIFFDELVDEATITATSFTLEDEWGTPVDGDIATVAAGAIFTPAAPLSFENNYTATVTTAVTDLAGNALATAHSWSFATHVRAWGSPLLLESSDRSAYDPDVACDEAGNGFVVWNQDGQSWANRYDVESGWSGATMLGDSAADVRVAANADGNAIAVWRDRSYATGIHCAHYQPGTGWGGDERIGLSDAENIWAPHIAINANGAAVAVWSELEAPATSDIWSNRYLPGTGWGTAELIENGDDPASSPHVAIDQSGNALAIWSQRQITWERYWVNRYQVGEGWGSAELVENSDGSPMNKPTVVVDAAGNGLAMWQMMGGSGTGIWVRRYIYGVGWGLAERIVADQQILNARMAMSPAGHATVVWAQSDGDHFNIWAMRYQPGPGWGSPECIETNVGSANDPEVAVDRSGNAVVVWWHLQLDNTPSRIYSNRFQIGRGWGSAMPIQTGADDARYPEISVDPDGNAIATWEQDVLTPLGNRTDLWANRFE